MGGVMSKSITTPCEDSMERREKVRVLEEEIKELRCKREDENRAYETRAAEFVTREVEWRCEKKKWKAEVRRLRKKLEARDERLRMVEDEMVTTSEKDLQFLGANFLVEHMREEQALREEAVEKWKRLYLAIKAELDDLIYRTRPGKNLVNQSIRRGARLLARIACHARMEDEEPKC